MSVAKKIAIAGLLSGSLISGIAFAQGFGPAGGAGPAGPAAMMSRLDTDGDGMISQAEFDAARPDRFATADADGDGQVTAEEFQTAALAAIEQRRLQRIAMMFDRLDADHDGVLTDEEAQAPAARMFARLDDNGDGLISPEEMDEMGRHARDGSGPGRGDGGRFEQDRMGPDGFGGHHHGPRMGMGFDDVPEE